MGTQVTSGHYLKHRNDYMPSGSTGMYYDQKLET